MDTLVPRIKNLAGTSYTDEDVAFAFYSHYVAGWSNVTQQVAIHAKRLSRLSQKKAVKLKGSSTKKFPIA